MGAEGGHGECLPLASFPGYCRPDSALPAFQVPVTSLLLLPSGLRMVTAPCYCNPRVLQCPPGLPTPCPHLFIKHSSVTLGGGYLSLARTFIETPTKYTVCTVFLHWEVILFKRLNEN